MKDKEYGFLDKPLSKEDLKSIMLLHDNIKNLITKQDELNLEIKSIVNEFVKLRKRISSLDE